MKKIARFLWELAWLAMVMLIATAGIRHGVTRYFQSAYPKGYEEIVLAESGRHGIPSSLVFAVIRTESGFDPHAQSSVQARGLMQITQPTFEWAQTRVREERDLHFDDLFQTDLNIRYGTAILGILLEEFGTVENALCAYHAGWGSAKSWLDDPRYAPDGRNIEEIPFGDTRAYVKRVMETEEMYQRLYDMA